MATPEWLRYANQNAIRNQPLNPRLIEALSFLPELGVTMRVVSGGETPERRASNSGRHLHGNAADADFFIGDRKLTPKNNQDVSILSQIVQRGKANGITGWGEGDDYMGSGRMHLGYGKAGVWGAGGKGANAPGWLSSAFNGAPLGSQIATQPASSPQAPGTPAPALPDPINVAQQPATPMQSNAQPPAGLFAAMSQGVAPAADKMSGLLEMLGQLDQPQQQPMQLQPMQAQANVPSLTDYISQFISGRMA